MNESQKGNLSSPRMLIFITRVEDDKNLSELLDLAHIPIFYQCRGEGTASSELMDIFGLGGTTRLITIGFLPKFSVKESLEKMGRKVLFHKKGGGIAITIPITGLQSPLFRLMNDDDRLTAENLIKKRIEKDMTEIHEKSEWNVIWISVAAGYSDQVVDTARKAGAKGGTVLRGRRCNAKHISQELGLSVQEEQEFVMIIAPRESKKDIMSAICDACGLHTPAHGTIISLPVDEAIGLER